MKYYVVYNEDKSNKVKIDNFFIDSNLRNSKIEEKLLVRAFLTVQADEIDNLLSVLGFKFDKIEIYKEETNELVYVSSKWNTLADVSIYHLSETNEVEVAYSYKFIK